MPRVTFLTYFRYVMAFHIGLFSHLIYTRGFSRFVADELPIRLAIFVAFTAVVFLVWKWRIAKVR